MISFLSSVAVVSDATVVVADVVVDVVDELVDVIVAVALALIMAVTRLVRKGLLKPRVLRVLRVLLKNGFLSLVVSLSSVAVVDLSVAVAATANAVEITAARAANKSGHLMFYSSDY